MQRVTIKRLFVQSEEVSEYGIVVSMVKERESVGCNMMVDCYWLNDPLGTRISHCARGARNN